jgi:hypothetical protein
MLNWCRFIQKSEITLFFVSNYVNLPDILKHCYICSLAADPRSSLRIRRQAVVVYIPKLIFLSLVPIIVCIYRMYRIGMICIFLLNIWFSLLYCPIGSSSVQNWLPGGSLCCCCVGIHLSWYSEGKILLPHWNINRKVMKDRKQY